MAVCQSTLVGSSDNPACLAFWDTAAGLVPVRVLALLGNGNADVRRLCLNDAKVLFEITANRGPYRRGEVLTSKLLHVWSRQHVQKSRRGPSYMIVRPHDWRQLLGAGHE